MLVSKARLLLAFIVIIALSPSTLVSPVSGQKFTGTTWARTFGPVLGPNSLEVTSDQGFVMLVHESPGSGVRVLKANLAGDVEWDRYYLPPGLVSAAADSVQQTRDGGYILAGSAELRLPVPQIYGPTYGWLLKLDDKGNVQWSKLFQGAQDGLLQAEQTKDGGYIAVGNIGLPSGHASNGWIVNLDSAGNIIWQEAFAGEDIYSVDQTRDGGFVVAGTVGVDNKAEAWVFKLDPKGSVVWQKAYAVALRTDAYSIEQTHDGGYIVVGHSSFGALILRLDRTGNIQWQKSDNGSGFTTYSVVETSDGRFVVDGRSDRGPFLLKLDRKGNMIWQKVYGIPNDFLYAARETREGGLVAVGSMATKCCGDYAWVLRLDEEGSIKGCPVGAPSNATLTDTVATITLTNLTAVETDATLVQMSVTVIATGTAVQVQCGDIVNGGKEERP